MSRCLSRVATGRTDTDWDAFLRSRQDSDIRWECPWWSLTEVTIELFGHCVPLAGLHYSSFYTPSRLYRQYGQIQRIVPVLPDFETSPLHPQFLDQISQTWAVDADSSTWPSAAVLGQMTSIKPGSCCRMMNRQLPVLEL